MAVDPVAEENKRAIAELCELQAKGVDRVALVNSPALLRRVKGTAGHLGLPPSEALEAVLRGLVSHYRQHVRPSSPLQTEYVSVYGSFIGICDTRYPPIEPTSGKTFSAAQLRLIEGGRQIPCDNPRAKEKGYVSTHENAKTHVRKAAVVVLESLDWFISQPDLIDAAAADFISKAVEDAPDSARDVKAEPNEEPTEPLIQPLDANTTMVSTTASNTKDQSGEDPNEVDFQAAQAMYRSVKVVVVAHIWRKFQRSMRIARLSGKIATALGPSIVLFALLKYTPPVGIVSGLSQLFGF